MSKVLSETSSQTVKQKLTTAFGLGAALMGLASASLVQAESIDFSFGDNAAKVQFSSDLPGNDLSWNVEALHYEENDADANILGAGVFVAGRSNASTARQTAGLGGKAIFVDPEFFESGLGVAVGGYLRHTLRQANLVSLRGELFFGPSIISFRGLERYLEATARVEYQLLDQANVFLGYSIVDTKLEAKGSGGAVNVEFVDSLVAGVNILF